MKSKQWGKQTKKQLPNKHLQWVNKTHTKATQQTSRNKQIDK